MKNLAYPLVAAILLSFSSAAFTQAGTPSSKAASAHNTSATIEPVLDTGNISYANAWRITSDKQAQSDGEIVFRIILKNDATDAIRISITIAKGTTKAELAKIIESTLKSKAPMGVKVERNAKDEISVSATSGISMMLDANTIADVDLKLARE